MSKVLKYKKIIFVALGVILIAGLAWAGLFYWKNLRGAWPILKKVSYETILTETGDLPFELPEGFSMEIFAEDLPGARVLVQDGLGNFWVSQPKKGKITLLEINNGRVTHQETVFENLNKPHGLAIDPNDPLTLYIAEEHVVSRVKLYAEEVMERILDLPSGGRHTTRTINFGPDGRLYISIGSSCDTCVEDDERRAAIYSMEKDGRDFRKFADGFRNAVFFDWSYIDGRMWATEMGRDFLGDNLPPDEINIVKEGRFYGWPYCYGKNIQDKTFDDSSRAGEICKMAESSYIDIPAHSSPLGLAFIPEEGWPKKYWYDLLVVYHGSWNRTEPTGYKIVRIDLDGAGNPIDNGRIIHDFITGWLTDRGTIGRPVDLFIQPGGLMYITDDGAGVVYEVAYTGGEDTTGFENEEQTGDNRSRGGCVITGCSAQICADEQVVTTCEFRPEYECYKSAVCERQANNQCNWTLTESLVSCLGEVRTEN